MSDIAVAIMAKAPIPGLAKTRLIPLLGEAGAASLHAAMLHRTVTTACAAALGPIQLAPITLWCAPNTDHPVFQALVAEFPIQLATQPQLDLGARMMAACQQYPDKATLVIGTDCPILTVEQLQQAARCLHYGGDAVLIPADDGGYVLIGLRQADRRVFDNIEWGSHSVLAGTRARLKAIGWHWNELQSLWDVDFPDDVQRLRREYPELGL